MIIKEIYEGSLSSLVDLMLGLFLEGIHIDCSFTIVIFNCSFYVIIKVRFLIYCDKYILMNFRMVFYFRFMFRNDNLGTVKYH